MGTKTPAGPAATKALVPWLILLVWALVVNAGIAWGQQRVTPDGRALDANPMVGSGGLNDAPRRPTAPTSQEIVTGNVTAGREFRDVVPYTDPGAFRDFTSGGASDRFVRDSAGAPTPFAPRTDMRTPQPFYGEARAAPPPPGFVRQGYAGGYVPLDPAAADAWRQMSVATPVDRAQVPDSNGLIMSGPMDQDGATLLSASPLYGVRQWRGTEGGDREFAGLYSQATRDRVIDRLRLDDAAQQRLRRELQRTIVADDEADMPEQRMIPFDAPHDQALPPQQMRDEVEGRPLDAQGRDVGVQHRPLDMAATPRRPTELQRRLEGHEQWRLQDQQQARQREQQVLRDRMAQAWAPEVAELPRPEPADEADPADARPRDRRPGTAVERDVRPGELPPMPAVPRAHDLAREHTERLREAGIEPQHAPFEAPPVPAPRPRDLPLVRSLADLAENQDFAEELRAAESLMAEGRFTSAIDRYTQVQQVDPDNAIALLGRAHAELGAGYYARAEGSLRRAFQADPALMARRYHLLGWYGQERATTVVEDLIQLGAREPASARPLLLLAYLYHNAGQPVRAAEYLTNARQRAEEGDWFYPALQRAWGF